MTIDVMDKSPVTKHSVVIHGHKTSVSVEEDFWIGVKEIARSRRMPIAKLVDLIDVQRNHNNLSSAVRLFVLNYYRSSLGIGM